LAWLRVAKIEWVRDGDSDNYYSLNNAKQIDVLAFRNTERIKLLLVKGEENITLDELTSLENRNCKVLKQQLTELVEKKFRENLQKSMQTQAQSLLSDKENYPDFFLLVYLRNLNLDLLDEATKEQVIQLINELEGKQNSEDEEEEKNLKAKNLFIIIKSVKKKGVAVGVLFSL